MFYSKLIITILNFFDYFQQKKIINFFKQNLNDKIIFFDVGSHHGETIKLFSKKFDIKEFHCFEASPLNFKILSQNIDKLNFKLNYKLNNLGVGSSNENAFINQMKESSSSTINDLNLNSKYLQKKLKILNIKKIDNFSKKIPIKLVTLDKYITENKQKKIDILKIDTEGFELNVIKGLILNHKIIKFIYFEHHYDDMIKKNYKFKDINYALKKLGFRKVFKTKMIFRKSFEYVYENSCI
tara:strand:+ start:587 stop:1306 length:720 start_codon:yes stop_codon:yes gene_type:complete